MVLTNFPQVNGSVENQLIFRSICLEGCTLQIEFNSFFSVKGQYAVQKAAWLVEAAKLAHSIHITERPEKSLPSFAHFGVHCAGYPGFLERLHNFLTKLLVQPVLPELLTSAASHGDNFVGFTSFILSLF